MKRTPRIKKAFLMKYLINYQMEAVVWDKSDYCSIHFKNGCAFILLMMIFSGVAIFVDT